MAMKWKTVLTAEEAALVAIGLDEYKSIYDADFDSVENISQLSDDETYALFEKIDTAKDIRNALLDEMNRKRSTLDIVIDGLSIYDSKATRESIARWFSQHDPDMAKRVWPGIEPEITNAPQAHPQATTPQAQAGLPQDAEQEPSPKARNAYLKLISALSSALIDGLTDKQHTDAEAVFAALARANIDPPVEKNTLANYLKEAAKL